MIWIVLVTLAVVLLTLRLVKRREPAVEIDDFSDEELVRAAVELHNISQRLNVAWTRHELRGETNRLRRELVEELRLVQALEADELSSE